MLERVITGLHVHELTLWAVADILILALLIYQFLILLRGTRAANVLLAMVALVLFYVTTGPGLLHLRAVHATLGSMLIYVPLAFLVLFQNQIRRGLANLGRNPFSALLPRRSEERLIEELSLAAVSLASKRIGSLVVIEREIGLRTFYESGLLLDALVSYDLLMNIFVQRSPLHDGAVIIAEGRIKSAASYLPLTTNPDLSRTYGTRHRAAIGVTEESDAIVVVTSEERGVVSLAEGGRIREGLDARSLQAALRELLHPRREARPAATAARSTAEGPGHA